MYMYGCALYADQLLTLSQTTSFRLIHTEKKFADDNFKYNENGRKFCTQVENTVGKRRNCSL